MRSASRCDSLDNNIHTHTHNVCVCVCVCIDNVQLVSFALGLVAIIVPGTNSEKCCISCFDTEHLLLALTFEAFWVGPCRMHRPILYTIIYVRMYVIYIYI